MHGMGPPALRVWTLLALPTHPWVLGQLRRVGGVQLVNSDQHAGLVAAIARCVQGAAHQRCRAHFARSLSKVAAALGAPVVSAGDGPLDLYVGSPVEVTIAVRRLGAAQPGTGSASLRVAPVHTVVTRPPDTEVAEVDGWIPTPRLAVALDLAQDGTGIFPELFWELARVWVSPRTWLAGPPSPLDHSGLDPGSGSCPSSRLSPTGDRHELALAPSTISTVVSRLRDVGLVDAAREGTEGEQLLLGHVHESGGLFESAGERRAHVAPLGRHRFSGALGEEGAEGGGLCGEDERPSGMLACVPRGNQGMVGAHRMPSGADAVVLRGPAMAGLVRGVAALAEAGLDRHAIVGGVAITARLGRAHRSTIDVDTVVAVDDSDLDAIPAKDALFVASHAWALQTATPCTFVAEAHSVLRATAPVATPAVLVAMKLHAIEDRHPSRAHDKRAGDAWDIYRLLIDCDGDNAVRGALAGVAPNFRGLVRDGAGRILVSGAGRTRGWLQAGGEEMAAVTADELRLVGEQLVSAL